VQIEDYLTFDEAVPVIFSVINVFRGIVGVVVSIVLTPVFLFFLLHDKQRVFKGIVSAVPKKYRVHVEELGIRANDVIEKYFNGRFLSMFIVSIMFTIVLLIFGFGLDKAIFFGFTLGFLDIIPYIGGFVGILLPVLYSFTITDTVLFGQWAFVWLVGINLVIQFIQGNILQPYIMGKEVNLHPLLVLSSFIFFGALFGITGIILAIPITGTIKTSFEYYQSLQDE
jgi:putative permease